MSASYSRPSPVRAQLVDSLMFGDAPTPQRLHDLLAKASTEAGWAAWAIQPAPDAGCSVDPDDELLAEAEDAIFKAYLAIYAYRCRERQQ